ncbi:TPA: hypothetical protein JLL44_004274 [Escherichia coli]|nr:hypothetical protein [Salmonella enterica]EDU4035630.1 hypothetical protein [Salmonella enterica]HAW7791721.1 hypothetical protein [Escherichia coli]
MKTHELISLAQYITKIMSFYPNKTVDYALDDILNLLEEKHKISKSMTSGKPKLKEESITIANHKTHSEFDEFVDKMKTLSIEEINKNLSNELLFPTIQSLKILANMIGIKSTSRQNRDVIVMNIIKTIERRRMDVTISDKDK